jgi:hypothetical protein
MFIRRMAVLLSAGVLAAGLSTAMTGTAQAAVVNPGTGWNEIWAPSLTAQSNTMCVDVPSGSNSVGLRLQLFHCHGYGSDGGPQRWQFVNDGTGSNGLPVYQIQNTANGLCVSFDAATGYVIQTSCYASGGWEVWSENLWSTDQNFALVSFPSAEVSNPLCIGAGNTTDSNHTPLVVTSCGLWFNDLQLWNLG